MYDIKLVIIYFQTIRYEKYKKCEKLTSLLVY